MSKVQFSSDANVLLSIAPGGTAKIWSLKILQKPVLLAGHLKEIESVDVSADSTCALTYSPQEATARIWNSQNGREIGAIQNCSFPPSFAPDGAAIIGGRIADDTALLSTSTGKGLVAFKGWPEGRESPVFSADGERVMAYGPAGKGSTLGVWETRTGKNIFTASLPDKKVTHALLTPDGRKIICCNLRQDDLFETVVQWDVQNPTTILSYPLSYGLIYGIAYKSHGGFLALNSRNGFVERLELETQHSSRGFPGSDGLLQPDHNPDMHSLVYSHDESLLASTLGKNVVIISSVTGREAGQLSGHTAPVIDIQFSKEDSRIITTANDRTIKVWDSATLRELLSFPGTSARISPGGDNLVIASGDNIATVFNSVPWKGQSHNDAAGKDWKENFSRLRWDRYGDLQVSWQQPTWYPAPSGNAGPPIFFDDFETTTSLSKWEGEENWRFVDGKVSCAASGGSLTTMSRLTAQTAPLRNFAVEADVEIPTGGRFSFLLRSHPDGSSYSAIGFGLDRFNVHTKFGAKRETSGEQLLWTDFPHYLASFISNNKGMGKSDGCFWKQKARFHLRLEVKDDLYAAFVDGQFIHRYVNPSPQSGAFELAHYLGDDIPSAFYDNVAIYPL